LANKINFWSFENEYDNRGISDIPATHLSIRKKEEFKTIRLRANIPQELIELSNKVSEIVGNRTWKNSKKQ